jgi:transcriptional regulator with XRE-family HTH domain
VLLRHIRRMRRTDLNLTCARRVREFRQRLGLSQDELAHKAGLHRTYIGAIERNERNITLRTLARLAVALRCCPAELLEAEE